MKNPYDGLAADAYAVGYDMALYGQHKCPYDSPRLAEAWAAGQKAATMREP